MKRLICILVLLSSISVLNAQTKPAITVAEEPKWEYLIVSFGKTYFNSENKLLAYKSIGIEEGQEGTNLQINLDILGKFGWEVIGIIGQIGGDQQIVLKRRFDSERIKKDKELIAQEEKRQTELELTRIKEATAWLAKQKEAVIQKKILVELDALEIAEKTLNDQAIYQKEVADKLKEIFVEMNLTYSFTISDNTINITITYDLTKLFLKENTYRKGEVEAYLTEQTDLLKMACEIFEKSNVSLTITGNITFMKTVQEVYYNYTLGGLLGDEWKWY